MVAYLLRRLQMIFEIIKKAKQLFYDNKNSGLDVNNVQDAIDDLTQAIVEVDAINEATGNHILLTDTFDNVLTDYKIYGRSTQDGTPTPDNPINIVSVGDSGSVEIKSTGKNLIPYPYYDKSKTYEGITYTDNGDGTIVVNGTAGAMSTYNLRGRLETDVELWLDVGTYILSGCPSGGSGSSYRIWLGTVDESGVATYLANDIGYSYTFTVKERVKIAININIQSGVKVDNLVFSPMIRRVEVTDATYEPYKSSSVSISLTEPLRSVGEVRDEIACIDGKYGVIRRIASKVFKGDSSEKWYKHTTQTNVYYRIFGDAQYGSNTSIWSHFSDKSAWPPTINKKYDNPQNGWKYACLEVATLDEWLAWLKANPVTIQYILAEEVFEPFSEQYNIITYADTTYIVNSTNANMWVEYYSNSSVGQRLAKTDEELAELKTVKNIDIKSGNTGSIYINAKVCGKVVELSAVWQKITELEFYLPDFFESGYAPLTDKYVICSCTDLNNNSTTFMGILHITTTGDCSLYNFSGTQITEGLSLTMITFNTTYLCN